MTSDNVISQLKAKLPDAEVSWSSLSCKMGGCGPEIMHLEVVWPDGRYAYGHFHPDSFVQVDDISWLADAINKWFAGAHRPTTSIPLNRSI